MPRPVTGPAMEPTMQRQHQAAMDNADVIRPVSAALIAPERTTAIRTAAKAQAASVPTAYSAVVIPDCTSCLSLRTRACSVCRMCIWLFKVDLLCWVTLLLGDTVDG